MAKRRFRGDEKNLLYSGSFIRRSNRYVIFASIVYFCVMEDNEGAHCFTNYLSHNGKLEDFMNMGSIIEWAIKIGICAFFCYYFFVLYTTQKKLSENLNNELKFFSTEVRQDNIIEQIPLIQQRMKENKILGQAWREFEDSLLKKQNSVTTTVDSNVYFNEYILVDVPLKLEVMRNIPAILTSLGIIGTFIGVLTGLSGYDSQSIEMVRTSVSHLLSGVTDAFWNSLLAISLALIFTLFEKIFTNNLYSQVISLQQAINRVFNRSVSEDYLQQMLIQSEQQSQALKSFSQDLSESIKVALDELVTKQTKVIISSSEAYTKNISQALEAQLSPSMERLNSVMDEVRKTQANAGEEAMQKMVADFKHSLHSSSNQQFDQTLQAISGAAEILGSVKSELGGFAAMMKEQATVQNEIVAKQMETLTAHASSSQTEMNEEFKGFIESISGNLGKLQSEMALKSTESIDNMSTKMAFTVSETVSKMGSETEKLLTANTQVNHEMMLRVDQLITQVDILSSKTNSATGDLTEKLQKGTASMAILLEQTDALSKSFVDILQKNGDLVKNTVGAIVDLQHTSQEINTSTESYKQIHQSMGNYIISFKQQLEVSEEKYNQLTGLLNSYKEAMDQVQSTVFENKAVVATLNEAINEDFANYVKITQESITSYLEELDKNLGTTVTSLNSAIGNLDDSLDGFSDSMDTMLKNRVG